MGSAVSGRAAVMKLGLRPPRASPSKVNWLTASSSPPTSKSERFILPCSSSKTRRLGTFSAIYLKSASPSPSSTPISTRNPAPIWPLISPSTLTLARSTR